MGKISSLEEWVKHWNRLVKSPSPEVFKKQVDVALGDSLVGMVGFSTRLVLTLEVFCNVNDSVSLN